MEAGDHHFYTPHHAVAMSMERIVNSKTDKIQIGSTEVVRIQSMGIIEKIDERECDLDIELKDDKENRLNVAKLYTSSYSRVHSRELSIGDYVDIHGKIRTRPDGTRFLNAFSIRKGSKAQFNAFKQICKCAEKFLLKRPLQIEDDHKNKRVKSLGLSDKIASMQRFPLSMLEESSGVENNNGEWPTELETLAAQMTDMNGESESSDGSDVSDSGEEEGVVKKEVKEEEENSFDTKLGADDDSFDRIQ